VPKSAREGDVVIDVLRAGEVAFVQAEPSTLVVEVVLEAHMNITQHNAKSIPFYDGEHAIPGIRFRAARQALGVSAWGMNVLDIDAHCSGYPEHDHKNDQQEEVYVVLEGSVVLIADGVESVLQRGDMVRVAPDVTRKLVTRNEGVALLAIGGTPGKAYAPDPRMG
jgi:uncharacterized cupin superfamily protein